LAAKACREVREHKYKPPIDRQRGLYLRSLISRLSARCARRPIERPILRSSSVSSVAPVKPFLPNLGRSDQVQALGSMLAGPDDVDRFGKRSSDGVLLEASRILNAEGKTQAIKYVREEKGTGPNQRLW